MKVYIVVGLCCEQPDFPHVHLSPSGEHIIGTYISREKAESIIDELTDKDSIRRLVEQLDAYSNKGDDDSSLFDGYYIDEQEIQ